MTDIIRARVEPELKNEATKVLNSLGLTPSAAIRILEKPLKTTSLNL